MNKDKEITIYDLAKQLGLSSATISRGLQNDPVVTKETRKKISELALALGYRSNQFAKNLRNQRTHTIGVVVPRLNSYFMSTVISGIENILNGEGYQLIITQSSESAEKEKRSVAAMFNNRVDGLLVSLAYETSDISHFDPFIKKNIPVIFFDRVGEYKKSSNILIDNRKAGYEATTHLISQGCKNIVHLTAAQVSNVYVDRLQGYKQALADHKIRFRKENVMISSLSQEAGSAAAEQILQMNPRPDAVFSANDNCAVGCMMTLKKAGIRIPDDIAFVGFNNDPVSTVIEPNLTTIHYPGYEMGEVAARLLISHLNGAAIVKTANTVLLPSELIMRASSRKQKKQGRIKT